MWNIKEDKLTEFKITCKNRLEPEGISGFFLGSIFFYSLLMFFMIGALIRFGWNYYAQPFEKAIVSIELVLYSLQLIFLVFYLFSKNIYNFQKLQTLVLLLYAFQTGTIMFTIFVLPGIMNYSTNHTTIIYVGFLFLGALIVHILTTIDTFNQAERGGFDIGENSSSLFSKLKAWIILGSLIYILVLNVLIIIHNNYEGDIYFGYFIATVIMYSIAIGAAEFQLLAYCRFKFASFNISWEERKRELDRYRKSNKTKNQKARKKKRLI
ncbi:hypothetical protein [Fictibacillus sp. FJAT-27399]|uniref:hypothetical protein n=1 Tax=Fictibacillus sp. FJAT-27399 TaxID=1729689 RepID=UPI0007829F3D|nr:hypothetical protein [Fictibacillus sp. FJAT-27399]